MKRILSVALALAFLAAASVPSFCQEVKTQPKMKTEMVKLKYARAQDIHQILMTYRSPQGFIQSHQNLEAITINDIPENVEKMLAVIKELDVKPMDFIFTVQLVLGSDTDEGRPDESLMSDPVIKELRNLLKYKSYSQLDTSLVRALDRERSEVTLGRNAELTLRIRPKYVKDEKKEMIQLETELMRMGGILAGQNPRRDWTTLISSNFTIKPGDKTVVGVSKMDGEGKGLILIISGKIVN